MIGGKRVKYTVEINLNLWSLDQKQARKPFIYGKTFLLNFLWEGRKQFCSW